MKLYLFNIYLHIMDKRKSQPEYFTSFLKENQSLNIGRTVKKTLNIYKYLAVVGVQFVCFKYGMHLDTYIEFCKC